MRRRFGLILLLLLFLPASGWAEDETPEPAPEEEDSSAEAPVFTPGEIVVTGRRSPAELTATVEEITAADIKAMGATNVAEALLLAKSMRVDMAPNTLSANGKQEALASLRGFDPRDVIVLIDGVPVYEPYFRVLDLRQLPVGDVAKITIVKGPSSVLYGPNSLGGIINIITKRGGGPARGHVDASYGDVEAYAGNGSVRGGAGGFEYFLAPGFAKSDGFRVSDDFDQTRNEDGGVRDNSDFQDFYASGKLGWYKGLSGLTLSANHYEFDGGVPFSMEALEPSTLWRKFWRKSSAALHGEWAAAPFLLLRGNAFYTRFFNTITTYTDASMASIAADGQAVSTYDNDVFGYHLLPEFLLGDFGSITLSLLYKRDLVSIQEETGGAWRDFGAETYSGGAEYGLSVYLFHVTAGTAYHLYRRTQTPGDDLGEDDGALDYQAGVAYEPLPVLTLSVGAARKSAFPDLKTLYGSSGNPDLEPEAATNIDAGFQARPLPALGFGSTWFYSDVTDLIGRREFGNDYTYENIDEATITGVESGVELTFLKGMIAGGLAHTWLMTEDKRETRNLERLDFRPEHTASVDGRLTSPFGTRLAVQFLYVGERQYEEPGKDHLKKALPEYGLLNARLSHTLSWNDKRTAAEVFVQGKNLLDVYYETSPEKPDPGRMLAAGVAVDF